MRLRFISHYWGASRVDWTQQRMNKFLLKVRGKQNLHFTRGRPRRSFKLTNRKKTGAHRKLCILFWIQRYTLQPQIKNGTEVTQKQHSKNKSSKKLIWTGYRDGEPKQWFPCFTEFSKTLMAQNAYPKKGLGYCMHKGNLMAWRHWNVETPGTVIPIILITL